MLYIYDTLPSTTIQHDAINATRDLNPGSWRYWSWDLRNGSTIQIEACLLNTSAPIQFYIFQGDTNYNNWTNAPLASTTQAIYTTFILQPCSINSPFYYFFSQDVTSFDRFYVTFFNNDQQNGASFTANLYSSRVEYDPSASSALYSCQTPCQGHYDYASDQFAIIQTTFNTGSQEVTWQGVNRPNYYGVIFGIIFTGVVFLFFCCLYRDYQRYQRVKDNPNVEMNTLNNQSGQHPMVIAQQVPVAQVHTQLQPFQSHSQYYPQTLGQPYPYTQPQQSIPIGQVVALPMSAQQPQYPMYYPQQQPMAHHSYAPQDLQQYS